MILIAGGSGRLRTLVVRRLEARGLAIRVLTPDRGGAPSTIVRATASAEFWLDLLDQTAASSGRPVIFGRAANPMNFVSVFDVAALVEKVVVDQSTGGAMPTPPQGGEDDSEENRKQRHNHANCE